MGILKIFSLFALLVYGVWGAFHQEAFSFINGVNLLFHEAGHVFFGVFGNEYVGIWGGTLLQLLFPLGIGMAFLKKGEKVSASIMFFWTCQNFIHISHYIQDSRAQVLHYVGGEIHDWHYILTHAGLLQQDLLIGNLVWGIGLLSMTFSVVVGLYLVMENRTA